MAFDSTKEIVLEEKAIEISEGREIVMKAFTYNGGEPKISSVRRNTLKDGSKSFGKLGALNAVEFKAHNDLGVELAQKHLFAAADTTPKAPAQTSGINRG